MYLITEKWDGTQKIIGNAPVIRLGGMDVVFVSLGEPTETVRAKAEETLRMYQSHAALVAIEHAARDYVRVHHSKGGEDYDGSLAPLLAALNSAKAGK